MKPQIDLEKCTRCLKCVKDCPVRAITIETGAISDNCIHCGHCIAICDIQAVSPVGGEVKALSGELPDTQQLIRLSAGVRSCRNYKQVAVPDELLQQLAEQIQHYPSASNARPLQVTFVRDPQRVSQLNDETVHRLVRMISLVTSPLLLPFFKIFSPGMNFGKLRSYKKSFLKLQQKNGSVICHHAPVVMLFHGPLVSSGMLEADANIWATYTTLLAHTLGLGSCFNGFIVKSFARKNKANEQFGIPADHRVYAALLLGYPAVRYKNEVSREAPMTLWR
ncbi:MAG: nitroreductase family protein [Marinilabiliales bacterium]|nr:nitroreductase family protein [Marinilabiliales bacterium]